MFMEEVWEMYEILLCLEIFYIREESKGGIRGIRGTNGMEEKGRVGKRRVG